MARKAEDLLAGENRFSRLSATVQRHGYWVAAAAVIVATLLFLPGRSFFPREQWALLYVLVVAVTAAASGTRPALLAAALSFLAWDFFFVPPFYTLQVADPADWIKLAVLLVVGVLIGAQTGRLRQREAATRESQQETASLNRLSGRLVSETSAVRAAAAVEQGLTEILAIRGAVLWLAQSDGTLAAARVEPTPLGPSPGAEPEHSEDHSGSDPYVAWAYANAKAVGPPAARSLEGYGWVDHTEVVPKAAARIDLFLPLSTATGLEGVLQVVPRGPETLESPPALPVIASVANLLASFLERRRLLAAAAEAKAFEESERLRATLVSSVSHELKTPLASLQATITGLLQEGACADPARVTDELSAVEADVERLDSSIEDLLDISRLEARTWSPSRDSYDIGEIIGTVVSWLPARARGRVRYAVPDEIPLACVDFSQVARALHNVLENALIYSGPDEPVEIGARPASDGTLVWVRDAGPGIPDQEKQLVYDKFYRGTQGSLRGSSTGLGLTVAKELVGANRGAIWVEDSEPHGAVFMILLPSSDAAAAAPAAHDDGHAADA